MPTLRSTIHHICMFATATVLVGCADDVSDPPRQKGVVDEAALAAGVTVVLRGETGEVAVPFLVPVPEVEGDTGDGSFENELSSAVSLIVTSEASGATANLASGTIVDGVPAAAGQWAWSLNAARDDASLVFFNETVTGLTLKPTVTYSASLSVGSNDYVVDVAPLVFPVTVVDG